MRRRGAPQGNLARGKNRVEIFRDFCTKLGFENINGGRSTTGEAVNILRGPADKIVLLQRVMDQTGGYDEISAEIIDPWQTVAATAAEASRLGRRFTPPDQDEIDRMLLED